MNTNIKENHKSEIQQKLKTKIKDETDTNEQTSTVAEIRNEGISGSGSVYPERIMRG